MTNMSANDNSQKVRFACVSCEAILKVSKENLAKKIKCPKCSEIIIPKECVQQASKEPQKEVSKPRKKRRLPLLSLLSLLILAVVGYWFLIKDSVSYDSQLLEPVISVDKAQKEVVSLSELELKAITQSYLQPIEALPKQDILPEYAAQQSRPARDLIMGASEKIDKLLKEENLTAMKVLEHLEEFDLAYQYKPSPVYLTRMLEAINQKEEWQLDEIINSLEVIKNQKETITSSSSQEYITFMAKVFAKLKEDVPNAQNPIKAIQLYHALELMPKGLPTEDLQVLLKPVLEDAFLHKNATRTDGLFLSPDESTQFSRALIQLAWQYHLDKKEMPEWLYMLAEKESCRLAYRLEPDGCLPDWEGQNNRNSLTAEIYKASLVFDRDDLRYIAYCGLTTQDAYPPEQTDFHFPEIGIFIRRNNWNIRAREKMFHLGGRIFHSDNRVITLNVNENKMSLSVGPVTQILFKNGQGTPWDLEDLKAIQFSGLNTNGEFTLDFTKIKGSAHIQNLSKFYKMLENNKVISAKVDRHTCEFTQLSRPFFLELKLSENDAIKEISFYTLKKEK